MKSELAQALHHSTSEQNQQVASLIKASRPDLSGYNDASCILFIGLLDHQTLAQLHGSIVKQKLCRRDSGIMAMD